jgi:hypothetical protein
MITAKEMYKIGNVFNMGDGIKTTYRILDISFTKTGKIKALCSSLGDNRVFWTSATKPNLGVCGNLEINITTTALERGH